ncbi:MAG: hypothetical protein IV094_23530 [Vitreoscilla sp.]|nr:hypothetical protein [Vitreoscilla sp.]
MSTSTLSVTTQPHYELRFQSLFNQGRALAFPCDAGGHVDLDALSERARENYFYARAVIGFEYAQPAVMTDYSH